MKGKILARIEESKFSVGLNINWVMAICDINERTQIDKYVTQFVCRGHILKDCQKIRRKNVEKLKLTANSSLTVFSQRGKHDLS